MKTFLSTIALAAALTLPLPSLAHEFAIVPQKWQHYRSGQELPISLVSSHSFLRSEELEDAASVTANYKGKPLELQANRAYLQYDGKVRLQPGGASIITGHRKGELWSNTPKGWLKGGKDTNKDALTSRKFEKFSKLLLAVDGKTEGFDAVSGDMLEIIPLDNPLTARVGDDIRVKVMLKGTAFTPEKITATYDGFSDADNAWAFLGEPDDKGNLRVRISAPGLWMIRTDHTIAEKTAEYDAHVLRATLLFNVRER